MRNLRRHPVTHQEIVDFLNLLKDQRINQMLIGDMGPVLLEAAIGIVDANRNVALRYDGKIATVADIQDAIND